MYRWYSVAFFTMVFGLGGVSALTDPYIKEQQLGIDLYLESDQLVYTSPTWFKSVALEYAPEDASYWIHDVLPYAQDRNEDMYLVIPQLGLVTPIVDIPQGTADFESMRSGREIAINTYLKGGIIEYVGSVAPGQWGKRIDFGHSNYYKTDDGRYKSIFANLMALDPGDQVRYYVRQWDGSYQLFKYNVDASYHTSPSNVAALQWDGEGADALIFGCTHGLDGRWLIEASYMGTPHGMPQASTVANNIPFAMKQRIDRALTKIGRMPTKFRKYQIVLLFKIVQRLENVTHGNAMKEDVVEYIQLELANMYPS